MYTIDKSITMHGSDETYMESLLVIIAAHMRQKSVRVESVSFWLTSAGEFIGTSIVLNRIYPRRFVWISNGDVVFHATIKELLLAIGYDRGHVKTYIHDPIGVAVNRRLMWIITIDNVFDNTYLRPQAPIPPSEVKLIRPKTNRVAAPSPEEIATVTKEVRLHAPKIRRNKQR